MDRMDIDRLQEETAQAPGQAGGTGAEFHAYGLDHFAYVKRIEVDGKTVHAVHAADGTPLTVLDGRDAAFATIIQNEMQPLSVH